MNAWGETVGVVLIAVGSAFAGRWFSHLPRPWWTLGYFIPMVFVVLTSLARWFVPLQFIPPFSWLVSGRTAFVIVGIITPMVLTTPLSRLPGKRLKLLVVLFLGVVVIQYSVLPFLHPALAYRQLAALETIIDADGVCLQGTDYTCGPAAAVTALRRLGLPANESELAILAHTSRAAGTPPDILAGILRRRYQSEGLRCEYRCFNSVTDLKQPGCTIAVIKFGFLVDHYVTVLEVNDKEIVVGDPLSGKEKYSHEAFARRWRSSGVVLRRENERGKP